MKPSYWLPAVLWVALLFLMSTGAYSMQSTSSIIEPVLRFIVPSISARTIDFVHSVIRKLAHLTEYFIFGLLLFRAFRSGSDQSQVRRWVFSSLVVLVLFAATDEVHQSLVPDRTGSVVDVVIDTAGGILALCVSALWFKQNRKMKKASDGRSVA
jgi:VanZ family protein